MTTPRNTSRIPRMRFLSPPGCALVALTLIALAATAAGCTSRWAVRGNVDLTGDATAAEIGQQSDPLLADTRADQQPADSNGGNP